MLRFHRPHKYRERVAETPKQIDKPAINVIVLARQVSLAARLLDQDMLQDATAPLLTIKDDNAADD